MNTDLESQLRASTALAEQIHKLRAERDRLLDLVEQLRTGIERWSRNALVEIEEVVPRETPPERGPAA